MKATAPPPVDALVVYTKKDLARRMGIGYSNLSRMLNVAPDFPSPRKLPGLERPVYIWAEVVAWVAAQPKEFE